MKSRFWQSRTSYVLLVAAAMIMVGPALTLRAGAITHSVNWYFAAGLVLVALLLGANYHETTFHTESTLRRLVESKLGHSAQHPLTRTCTLEELRSGETGWAQISELGIIDIDDDEFGNKYVADKRLQLTSRPASKSPVLVFRDEDDQLHLLRFGRQPTGTLPLVDPQASSCIINDGGYVGPARFEPAHVG